MFSAPCEVDNLVLLGGKCSSVSACLLRVFWHACSNLLQLSSVFLPADSVQLLPRSLLYSSFDRVCTYPL